MGREQRREPAQAGAAAGLPADSPGTRPWRACVHLFSSEHSAVLQQTASFAAPEGAVAEALIYFCPPRHGRCCWASRKNLPRCSAKYAGLKPFPGSGRHHDRALYCRQV